MIRLAPFLLLLAFGPTARAADAAKPTSPAPANDRPSVGDLVRSGGLIMVPIGVCSVLLASFLLERCVTLRKSRVLPPELMQELTELRKGERLDPRSLEDVCARHPSPLANVAKAALLRQGHPLLDVEKVMEDAAARELSMLRAGVRPLTAIASIAPLLGLLGTVFGMIDAFIVTSRPGLKDRTELLAAGIYEALVATAGGLLVAVPALIAAYVFSGRLEKLSRAMGDFLTPLVPALVFRDPEAPGAASGNTSPLAKAPARWR